ncbi:MAG: hypothetical protein HY080_03115 [Gammaproteobacteria bacterium]|nr:hypothetical protein [Gammaproteobacteria bacterium]
MAVRCWRFIFIHRMLQYQDIENLDEPLSLAFLLDTRDTLTGGFPAALAVIEKHRARFEGKLKLSVRLDSGDLRAQFKTIASSLRQRFSNSASMPSVIVESGLTALDVANFERLAREFDFNPANVLYGIGSYLVGGINRDFISLVYKLSAFGGNASDHVALARPTMKFGDEPNSGKESYPGHVELLEKASAQGITRQLALSKEMLRLRLEGWQSLYIDLIKQVRPAQLYRFVRKKDKDLFFPLNQDEYPAVNAINSSAIEFDQGSSIVHYTYDAGTMNRGEGTILVAAESVI